MTRFRYGGLHLGMPKHRTSLPQLVDVILRRRPKQSGNHGLDERDKYGILHKLVDNVDRIIQLGGVWRIRGTAFLAKKAVADISREVDLTRRRWQDVGLNELVPERADVGEAGDGIGRFRLCDFVCGAVAASIENELESFHAMVL